MSDTNVVNPGIVNVADQADGLITVNQTITVTPSTNPGPVVPGANLAPGKGLPTPPNTTPSMTSQRTVQGGTFSPQNANVTNTTQNTIVGQVYGAGTPQNVFV